MLKGIKKEDQAAAAAAKAGTKTASSEMQSNFEALPDKLFPPSLPVPLCFVMISLVLVLAAMTAVGRGRKGREGEVPSVGLSARICSRRPVEFTQRACATTLAGGIEIARTYRFIKKAATKSLFCTEMRSEQKNRQLKNI